MASDIPAAVADPSAWVERIFQHAGDAVRVAVHARGLEGATTLAVAVIHDGVIAVGTAGDTGIFIVSESGAIDRLTAPDHVPAAPHMLLQWLDGVTSVTPHVRVLPTRPGWVLLLSDGISGVVPPESLVDIVRARPPSAAADALVMAARHRDSSDDATALVVRVTREVSG